LKDPSWKNILEVTLGISIPLFLFLGAITFYFVYRRCKYGFFCEKTTEGKVIEDNNEALLAATNF